MSPLKRVTAAVLLLVACGCQSECCWQEFRKQSEMEYHCKKGEAYACISLERLQQREPWCTGVEDE